MASVETRHEDQIQFYHDSPPRCYAACVGSPRLGIRQAKYRDGRSAYRSRQVHQARIVAHEEISLFESCCCYLNASLTCNTAYGHSGVHHTHDLLVQFRLFRAAQQDQLSAGIMIKRIGQLGKTLRSPAAGYAISSTAGVHGNKRAFDAFCWINPINKLPGLLSFLFVYRYSQAFIARCRAYSLCYRKIVFGFVHSTETLVLDTCIEKSTMTVI